MYLIEILIFIKPTLLHCTVIFVLFQFKDTHTHTPKHKAPEHGFQKFPVFFTLEEKRFLSFGVTHGPPHYLCRFCNPFVKQKICGKVNKVLQEVFKSLSEV